MIVFVRIFFLLFIFNFICGDEQQIIRDFSWKNYFLNRCQEKTKKHSNKYRIGSIPITLFRLLEQLKKQLNERSTKILLYGPPGNGKTTITHTLAEELEAEIIILKGSLIVGAYINQGATTLEKVFEDIKFKLNEFNVPIILFIDEIDQIARKNTLEVRSEHDSAVHTLWLLLDDLKYEKKFIFIGATNSFATLDPALVDRFGSNCIEIEYPDREMRKELLMHFFKQYHYSLPEDLKNSLVAESEGLSIRSLENLVITCYEHSKYQESSISESMIWEELKTLKKRNDLINNSNKSTLKHWQILSNKSSVLATLLGSIISFVYLTEKTITYLHYRGIL